LTVLRVLEAAGRVVGGWVAEAEGGAAAGRVVGGGLLVGN
jgi:hypothetical protein